MVADNFREIGTRLLTPLARNFPLDPMGISLLSLATAIGAGYCFSQAEAGSVLLLFAAGLVFLTALLGSRDGIVARIRDLASKQGDLVDHTLDRVADVIILGGGLSNVGRLYENVPALWSDWVFSECSQTRLLANVHGDSSGVRGAAWLWDE